MSIFHFANFQVKIVFFLRNYKTEIFKLLLIMVSFSAVVNQFIFMQSKSVCRFYNTSGFPGF